MELCLLIYSTDLLILGIQFKHVFGHFPRCDSQQSTAFTFSAASLSSIVNGRWRTCPLRACHFRWNAPGPIVYENF